MTIEKRIARMIRRCEQMIATVEWWNKNRPEEVPMDCEPERIGLKLAREIQALWQRGESVAAQAKIEELIRYAHEGWRD